MDLDLGNGPRQVEVLGILLYGIYYTDIKSGLD